MKKLGWLVIHSLMMFVAYLLSSVLILMVLSTTTRRLVPAESWGEALWKMIFLYIDVAAVSAVYLESSGAEHKRAYLLATEGRAWTARGAIGFTVRNPDFWLRTAAFLLWSLILPKWFGGFFGLLLRVDGFAAIPRRLLVIPTVWLPCLLLHLIAWLLETRRWHKGRLHK